MKNEKKIIKLMESLAEKLGTTTEMLWGVMIKQARIEIISMLIQFVVILCLDYLIWVLADKYVFNFVPKNKYDMNELGIIVGIFGTVGIVGSALCIITSISDFISAIFNPKYWALNKILEQL